MYTQFGHNSEGAIIGIEAGLEEDFAAFRNEIEVERKALEKHKKRLLGERAPLPAPGLTP